MILDRNDPDPDRVIRYADHEFGLIDTYLPERADAPDGPATTEALGTSASAANPRGLVVLIHGGSWRNQYDRAHLRPLAAAIAQAGYAVALPEFRRVGGGGEWPVIGHDVEAALAVAEKWGAEVLGDAAGPMTIAGHSSGGHLALWSGLRAGADRVARIVAISPFADVYRLASERLSDGAAQDLLGGEPADRADQYAEADPLRLLPSDTAVLFVQGAADGPELVTMSRDVAAEHPGIAYHEIPGADHFDVVDPDSPHCVNGVIPFITGRDET